MLNETVVVAPIELPVAASRTDPVAVYIASLRSPHSRRVLAGRLKRAAKILLSRDNATVTDVPWLALRYEHLTALQAELVRRGYAAATTNLTIVAVRGVLRVAARMRLIDRDTFAAATEGIPNEPTKREPAGRMLPPAQIGALFVAAARNPDKAMATRDVAMLAIALGAGLRREDLVALTLGDLDLTTGAMSLVRKGRRHWTGYLSPQVIAAVQRWLEVRGKRPGALFCALWKLRIVPEGPIPRLNGQTVAWSLARLVREAGIPHCSAHDLRRSFVSNLWELGEDAATVKALAGHQNVNTTVAYDRRGEAGKMRAVARIELPLGLDGTVMGTVSLGAERSQWKGT